jgi:PadR family transcriptional regulator PadR
MRLTHALVQVVVALANSPFDRHWGYELSKQARVRSGVLYPILQRMLDAGWLEDGWEDRSEIDTNRPPRRYYRLTDEGRHAIGGVVERARSDPRFVVFPWAGDFT